MNTFYIIFYVWYIRCQYKPYDKEVLFIKVINKQLLLATTEQFILLVQCWSQVEFYLIWAFCVSLIYIETVNKFGRSEQIRWRRSFSTSVSKEGTIRGSKRSRISVRSLCVSQKFWTRGHWKLNYSLIYVLHIHTLCTYVCAYDRCVSTQVGTRARENIWEW